MFKNIIKKNSTPDLKGDKVVRRLKEEVYFLPSPWQWLTITHNFVYQY